MPETVGVTAPRRVYCVYERQHERRVVADAVVVGLFPIQGTVVALGVEPDWQSAALPADREWRLEWSKFYYGLDLAAAAEATGDARYLHAWQRLVGSWIAQVPVDFDSSDVIGRRIQNWLYAWARFAAVFAIDAGIPGFEARITASLQAQLDRLRRQLTSERNHRTLELYALFVAALALPTLDPDGDLLRFAIGALHENLLADVLPDGVHRERSTHYHHVVLRSFVGMRENARRFALDLPPGFDQRLTRACEFALHCHRPDGSIPALSDSDSGSYLDLLATAGDLLGREDFVYVATRGRDGHPPTATAASFPDGGYFMQRSGWGAGTTAFGDERYLIFDCGPVGDGGHGHYDALSVEIAANGAPIVVDPGRFTYAEAPPHWRRWFKGTAAHNTVTIDGVDQTPYRSGKPKGDTASSHLLQRATVPRLDVLWGQTRSPSYEVVHRRRVLFVDGTYWLIEDELDGDRPHHYQLRLHLTPDQQDVRMEPTADGAAVISDRVAIVVVGNTTAAIEPGWVSVSYGIKEAAPILTFTTAGEVRARFVTLVAPRPSSTARVPRLAVQIENGVVFADVKDATASGVCERVAWSSSGLPVAIDEGCTGVAVWTRQSVVSGAAHRAVVADVAVSPDLRKPIVPGAVAP